MLTPLSLASWCFPTAIFLILTKKSQSPPCLVEAFSPAATLSSTHCSHLASMAKIPPKIGHSRKKSAKRSHSSSPPGHSRGSTQHYGDGNVSIESMLGSMTEYFYSMVDPRTNRFYYRCLPESGRLIHTHCPIRDLGSAWDVSNLLTFLSKAQPPATQQRLMSEEKWNKVYARLSAAVIETIGAFSRKWALFEDESTHRSCAAIPSKVLREASTIAHSAFVMLATVGAMRLSIANNNVRVPLDELANGILYMQNESGAFAIHFGDSDIFRGIEFYPGEAILALLDSYTCTLDTGNAVETQNVPSASTLDGIITAAKKAFLFYAHYYRGGNVDPSYTSFFANWQVQSFGRLFDILLEAETQVQPRESDPTSTSSKTSCGAADMNTDLIDSVLVSSYVFELCDAVTASIPWQALSHGQYTSLSTVEIACGLEAIAEGTLVALKQSTPESLERLNNYVCCMNSAIHFLAAVQDQVPPGALGAGGLGYGLGVSEQRLDVTGHAVNALIKVHQVQQKTEVYCTRLSR